LFGGLGGGAPLAQDVKHLRDVLAAAAPAKRKAVVAHLSRAVQPVLEKALLHPPMTHRCASLFAQQAHLPLPLAKQTGSNCVLFITNQLLHTKTTNQNKKPKPKGSSASCSRPRPGRSSPTPSTRSPRRAAAC
jgi:hypothetical protein